MVKCKICGKEYSKKGIGTHLWRSHGDGKKHNPNIGFADGSRKIWNKNLNKDNDERVKKCGETYSLRIKNGDVKPGFKNLKHSNKTKQKISEKLSINNRGGRCKWYQFQKSDGSIVKVQGTWELRFAHVLEKIDPKWIKPAVGNKDHCLKWNDGILDKTYTPDFWSPKLETYFEVKGYWWGNDREKMKNVKKQNPSFKIKMIMKSDLESLEKFYLEL